MPREDLNLGRTRMEIRQQPSELVETLLTLGASYFASVETLIAAARDQGKARSGNASATAFNGELSPAIHLLMGFSFELLLKAAFLHNGGEEQELRKIGHDLTAALDAAERMGFAYDGPAIRGTLAILSQPHIDFYFRYGGPDFVDMPPLEISIPILERLAMQVGLAAYGLA